jgi:hypothetical protein
MKAQSSLLNLSSQNIQHGALTAMKEPRGALARRWQKKSLRRIKLMRG